jgi:hypothetical protein
MPANGEEKKRLGAKTSRCHEHLSRANTRSELYERTDKIFNITNNIWGESAKNASVEGKKNFDSIVCITMFHFHACYSIE